MTLIGYTRTSAEVQSLAPQRTALAAAGWGIVRRRPEAPTAPAPSWSVSWAGCGRATCWKSTQGRGVDAKVCHPSSVASSSFLTLPVAVIGRLPKMRMRGTL